MTKKEHEQVMREFEEARALVKQLNSLTDRIEYAADRALETYIRLGVENGAN